MNTHDRSKVSAIVKRELGPLMKILGIDSVFIVENQNEVLDTLAKLIGNRELGVIIVQRSLIKDIDLTTYLQNTQIYPSIIAIPDTLDDLFESPKAFYRDIIRRFIGYEVYLE